MKRFTVYEYYKGSKAILETDDLNEAYDLIIKRIIETDNEFEWGIQDNKEMPLYIPENIAIMADNYDFPDNWDDEGEY